MTKNDNDDEEPRDIAAGPEGSGRKDRTAPVSGAEFRPGGIDGNALFDQLPKRQQAKFAKRWQQTHPDWIAAKKVARREHIRLVVTLVIFAGIVAEAGVALYLVVVAKSVSWDTIKDWLTLSLAPLVAAATVTSTFWFPSREAD